MKQKKVHPCECTERKMSGGNTMVQQPCKCHLRHLAMEAGCKRITEGGSELGVCDRYGRFPSTELGVDLKLWMRCPGRFEVGVPKSGELVRRGDDSYVFKEAPACDSSRMASHRNPHVYKGSFINIICDADGACHPTFKRPRLSPAYTIKDYCCDAAQELYDVALHLDNSDLDL